MAQSQLEGGGARIAKQRMWDGPVTAGRGGARIAKQRVWDGPVTAGRGGGGTENREPTSGVRPGDPQ
eukprot:366052-Chlamydomonas_euryale.AAC.15